jgi:hypothetical protein
MTRKFTTGPFLGPDLKEVDRGYDEYTAFQAVTADMQMASTMLPRELGNDNFKMTHSDHAIMCPFLAFSV